MVIKDRYVEHTLMWDREVTEVWHEYESGNQMYITRTTFTDGTVMVMSFSLPDHYVQHYFSNIT